MKNRLSDLNDHLFTQIERLCDETLDAEAIKREATRADAISAVADQIIRGAQLQLRAAEMVVQHGARITPYLPPAIWARPAQEPPRVIPSKLAGEQ
jgi:hypothetical protein